MARGAVWMVLFKLLERTLGFISTLILARLLVPADFGLVAMATSFIALLELMSAFGFDVAIIRIQSNERKYLDSGWTLYVLLGLVTAVLLLAGAYPLAHFYDEPRLPAVLAVLAIGSLVTSFENIGVVEFRRQMDFAREFRFQLARKVAGFSITVPLAFLLRNHWALIAGMVAGRVVSTAWSYYVHPFRPRFSFEAAGELVGFSKWLLGNNMLSFLKERGSDFIIGRISGRSALGLYSVGYEIANLPTTELVAPINRAVMPGYAKLADDMQALRAGFVSVISIIALCAVPAGVGIAAVAPLATEVLLGAKWLAAIPVIEIVALHGVVTALQTNVYSAYIAMNQPQLMTRISLVYVIILLPLSIWLTSRSGIVGTSYACLITAAIMAPVNYAVVLRCMQMRARIVLRELWRPIVGAIVMWFAVRALSIAEGMHALPGLIAEVALGGATYVATVGLLWLLAGRPSGAERFVLERARKMLPRLARQ